MKTKLFLSLFFTFLFCLLSSQVPQGFNYQAIARDDKGNPLPGATLQVKMSIQSDASTANEVFWEELFNPVTTNDFGLFTVVIGTGVRQSGSALSFTDIDWTKTPMFLKVLIYYQNQWKYMGTVKLWSVPYSMVAGNLEGSVNNLEVMGDDITSDGALFEVKRKDGQVMFAVYNHGVRVYMPLDTLSKAKKGGFAIGGFDKSKGIIQEYFVVNPDSIRAYIDTNSGKAKKGGFAIGGFDKSKAVNEEYLRVTRDSTRIYLNDTGTKARKGGFAIGGFDKSKANIQDFLTVCSDSIRMFIDDNLGKAKKGGFAIGGFDKTKAENASFFNVFPDSTGKVSPSQNRILWYPLKNALLAGRVLAEHKDSVGENSFASGFESKAKGKYSQALGYKAIARGDYSTAIGKNAIAQKINSFAFGDSASAANSESYAIGRGAVASGYRSFAFGSAGLDSAGKVTDVARAIGDYSFAIGQGSQSLWNGSFAIGISDTTKGELSFALGYSSCTNHFGAIALGYQCLADGRFSTALGFMTKAYGFYSTAIGCSAHANGYYSSAIGYAPTSNGFYSTALGYMTTANMPYSTAMGSNTTASGQYSTAMGTGTIASGMYSTAMGLMTKASTSYSTTMGYRTTASGMYSTATGNYTIANSYNCFVIGRYNDSLSISYNSWNIADPLFIIGNGSTNETRSNALTVLKNGHIGLQSVTNPTYALELSNNSDIGVGRARAYSWDTYSDERIKSDRKPLPYGLTEIMLLKPQAYFQHNSTGRNGRLKIESTNENDIGLIAQEVYKIIPEVVTRPKDEEKDLWSLSYGKLVPVLIKGIQEQQAIIDKQQKELEELKILINGLITDKNIKTK